MTTADLLERARKNTALDDDSETLGILGGILKRRWRDLGQLSDLQQAAQFYERGAKGAMGDDAYPHINAAFLQQMLAHAGDEPTRRLERTEEIHKQIVTELRPSASWFNAATKAEALFGLKHYAAAADVVAACTTDRAPWELETTARQISTIACMQHERPLDVPEIRRFFETLLPGASEAIQSVTVGRVGLALSGGGFRASLYHLGVLARLSELNVLRHIDVLSCVSGGSIVGAFYWLALRRRMLQPGALTHQDYLVLVQDMIAEFTAAIALDLRGDVSKFEAFRRLLRNEKGVLDVENTARALDEKFYGALFADRAKNCMHDLPFNPSDHDPSVTKSQVFHPGRHNWLRANKVPVHRAMAHGHF